MPRGEFPRFEAANPTILLPVQSAAERISLQCTQKRRKVTYKCLRNRRMSE